MLLDEYWFSEDCKKDKMNGLSDKRGLFNFEESRINQLKILRNDVKRYIKICPDDRYWSKEFIKLEDHIEKCSSSCMNTKKWLIVELLCGDESRIESIALDYLVLNKTIEEIEQIIYSFDPDSRIGIENIIRDQGSEELQKLKCKYDDLQDELTKTYAKQMENIQNQERKLRDDIY